MTTETAETPAATLEARTETPSAQWRPGDPTPRLNKALSQLQGNMPRIKKTKTGEIKGVSKTTGEKFQYEYKYADLGDVVADIGPLLAKYGLSFHGRPTINPVDRREMLLIWKLKHESGEEETGEWPLGPTSQKPQDLGSALTYARRYSFTAATNIVLEDDDDGQRAQQAHGSRQSAGDAWESSTRERPQRNGSRDGDGPKPDQVAQALAKLALQVAADPAKTAADFSEQVEKRAAGKGKLDAPVANPFGEGLVKLRDVLREARRRMDGQPGGEHDGQGAAPGVGEAHANAEQGATADDPADAETAFVIAYMARVADATDEELAAMRPEIGAAVKAKIISPKVAGELSAAVSAARRKLAEPAAS